MHEEFIRHAAECESMAKMSSDPESRAAWSGMAQRWVRCAATAKNDELYVRERRKKSARRRGGDPFPLCRKSLGTLPTVPPRPTPAFGHTPCRREGQTAVH